MSNKDEKKGDQNLENLSEWQKLNKSYLEKKAQEEVEKEENLAHQKKERLGQEIVEESSEEVDLSLGDETIAAKHRRKQAQKRLEKERLSEDESESEELEESEELDEVQEEVQPQLSKEEKAAAEKAKRKADRLAKKAEKKKDRIARRHVFRAIPVVAVSILLFLLSLYFMTPLSTAKKISISGNKEVSQEALLKAAKFDTRDYTLTTYFNRKNHARNMAVVDPWIEKVSLDYSFPIDFHIRVKEYKVVAYYQEGGDYYPILANGYQIEKAVLAEEMPESFIKVDIQDQTARYEFVKYLAPLSSKLKNEILEVKLTPTKATKDLLTIQMADGHKVLVPLSELQKKLPYYTVVKEKLAYPSVVDMEAGVYSYSIENEKKEETSDSKDDEKTDDSEVDESQVLAEESDQEQTNQDNSNVVNE